MVHPQRFGTRRWREQCISADLYGNRIDFWIVAIATSLQLNGNPTQYSILPRLKTIPYLFVP